MNSVLLHLDLETALHKRSVHPLKIQAASLLLSTFYVQLNVQRSEYFADSAVYIRPQMNTARYKG